MIMILKRILIFVVLCLDASYKLDSHEKVCILLIRVSEQSVGVGGQTRWTQIFSSENDFHHFPPGSNRTGGIFLLMVGFFCFLVIHTWGMCISLFLCRVSLQVSCHYSQLSVTTVRHASGSGWYMYCVFGKQKIKNKTRAAGSYFLVKRT